MSQRVLSTEQAREAITQIQSILSGGLESTIAQLKQQGGVLSDPNVWDGPLAADFRGNIWPSCTTSLDKTTQALQELQTKLHQINENIISAGGGA